VHLAEENTVGEKVIVYLNRLSDYFFVLARAIAHEKRVPENQWRPRG
jgi:cob(I)alamin adenosyltransferase